MNCNRIYRHSAACLCLYVKMLSYYYYLFEYTLVCRGVCTHAVVISGPQAKPRMCYMSPHQTRNKSLCVATPRFDDIYAGVADGRALAARTRTSYGKARHSEWQFVIYIYSIHAVGQIGYTSKQSTPNGVNIKWSLFSYFTQLFTIY